jgi:hypothetical protein
MQIQKVWKYLKNKGVKTKWKIGQQMNLIIYNLTWILDFFIEWHHIIWWPSKRDYGLLNLVSLISKNGINNCQYVIHLCWGGNWSD